MKTLSRDEKIAVSVAVVIFVALLLPFFMGRADKDEAKEHAETLQENVLNRELLMNEIENTEGLTVEVLKQGDGEIAVTGSTVSVHYVGTLEDKTVFDSSYLRGEPLEFTLGENRVIQGWERGVLGMQVGEKRQLIIEPALAYGDDEAMHPLGGKTLYFEVTLMGIVNQGAELEEVDDDEVDDNTLE